MSAQPLTSSPSPAAGALRSLAVMQQLGLEAGLSDSPRQLIFRILNRTVALTPYDRAALWRLDTRSPRLIGVSGEAHIDRHTPLASQWRHIVRAIDKPDEPAILSDEQLTPALPHWHALGQQYDQLSVAWIPIRAGNRLALGLWLERWDGEPFNHSSLKTLSALALSYGIAWRAHDRRHAPWRRWLASRRQRLAAGCTLAAILALLLIRVPLRIVAPCEVIPADPIAIAAPLEGVIDRVLVEPGRQVQPGQPLATYDQRIAREQLKIARQQVQVIESERQRIRLRAFDDPEARAQIAQLEKRLQQEHTRLSLAEYRASQLEIRAPQAGAVMLSDPNAWRGRPVLVGERIMMLVDPKQTRLLIHLPESDRIEFDREQPVKVVLDADPGNTCHADLRMIANHSHQSPAGFTAFRAEADWQPDTTAPRLGLKGTAILKGPRVSLGYYLLRKPLAATRKYLGW